MITFTKAYVANGKAFASLSEAKAAELAALLSGAVNDMPRDEVVDWVLVNATKIVDILTTKESSKPAERKINGGRKVRKNGTPAPDAAKTLNA